MKKKLGLVAGILLCSTALFGQVLQSNGVKNTLSTSFGRPYGYTDDSNRSSVRFYGFVDTLQTRFDVSKFTVEAMLNWGVLGDWEGNKFSSMYFANTQVTPFYYTNHFDQGGWWTNGDSENYYVNFLFHPIKGLDLGIGTRLEWKIGPAPSSLGNYWEPLAHIVQGGLKDSVPGGADVAGYTYYANTYTALYQNNTKSALGARYRYEDFIEAGISIPSGVTTEAPLFNAAFKIHPIDIFTASISYEGILRDNGNLYTGLSLFLKNITLDAYLGINFRPENKFGYSDQRWGTGAAVKVDFPKINLSVRPELGFTFYKYSDYTLAWYTGARVDFKMNEDFNFGIWGSFGVGAADKNWKNDWTGGHVFDIRPDITWNINKNHSISAFFDYQNRKKFDQKIYDVWASGFYWTFLH